MTYIVSGKFRNNPFLMVDCIATQGVGDIKTLHFRNKLKKLISTEDETYCCLTGVDSYQHAINAFDEKCYWNECQFNIKDISQINEIVKIFNYLVELYPKEVPIDRFCRLYFIDKKGVYYYNIDDDGILSELHEISNNNFIKSNCAENAPITLEEDFETKEEIINFCKNEIIESGNNAMDFKDKFSYAVFCKNEKTVNNSMRDNREIVLSMIAGDYNEIS